MKKVVTISTKSFMFCMSIIAVIGIVWSCAEDEYDPGIRPPVINEIAPDSAFETQEVIIDGINFSSAAADNLVSFNGTPAIVTKTTAYAITTTVPVGATSGNVTVTVNDKTSAGYPFTVLIPVIPAITSIDPTSGKVRDVVTITGENFSTTPSENIVSFNGILAEVTASTTTSITTSVPPYATTGNVTVTTDVESNGVMFTVIASPYLEIQITESIDDVEEASSTGMIDSGSSDLELGEFDTTGDPDYGLQTIGLRFNNVTIPASSTILAANIQFTCDDTGADPVQLTIYGEDIGNAPAFEDLVQYTVTSRTKTAEYAVWDVPEWVAEGDAGPAQLTVDLSSIVQEIIDRVDWASGNSIVIIIA